VRQLRTEVPQHTPNRRERPLRTNISAWARNCRRGKTGTIIALRAHYGKRRALRAKLSRVASDDVDGTLSTVITSRARVAVTERFSLRTVSESPRGARQHDHRFFQAEAARRAGVHRESRNSVFITEVSGRAWDTPVTRLRNRVFVIRSGGTGDSGHAHFAVVTGGTRNRNRVPRQANVAPRAAAAIVFRNSVGVSANFLVEAHDRVRSFFGAEVARRAWAT